RHAELVGQHDGDRLGATIGQREVVDVVAGCISVTFDQEHFAWVALDGAHYPLRHVGQAIRLVGGDFPRAGFEIYRVDVDSGHSRAQRLAIEDLIECIVAFDAIDRWRHQGQIDVVRRRSRGFPDVELARNAYNRRRQLDKKSRITRTARFEAV